MGTEEKINVIVETDNYPSLQYSDQIGQIIGGVFGKPLGLPLSVEKMHNSPHSAFR